MTRVPFPEQPERLEWESQTITQMEREPLPPSALPEPERRGRWEGLRHLPWWAYVPVALTFALVIITLFFVGAFNTPNATSYPASREEAQSAASPLTIEQLLEKGLEYDNQGEFEKAIEQFNEALRLGCNCAEAYNGRGWAYYSLKWKDEQNLQLAMNDYERAIERDPYFALAFNNRGLAHEAQGNFDLAMKDYDKATELDPNLDYPYNNRGWVYIKWFQSQRALDEFNRAVEINLDYAEAYAGRARAYQLKYDQNSAIADLNKAISLMPDYAYAYSSRGYSYFIKGELEKAVSDYTRAIELDPDDAGAYFYRAKAHHARLSDPKERALAIADYKKALEANEGKDRDMVIQSEEAIRALGGK